jgi:hypothetical protein|tara:strand:+ start:4400 stop:4555 length:156 start_codon:yes stop_codon:yes gene_type:complete
MPNEWMYNIVKILDEYYNAKIDEAQCISKINTITNDYEEEFKLFEKQFDIS